MKDGSRLVDKNGNDVAIGTKVGRGSAKYTITGWRAPHKASSTGRVWVESEGGFSQEFFPTVFDLEIVDHPFERKS